MNLHLHGLGHFHPENEITNAFLESLDIGTTDDWILDRVGIRSRRTALPLDYIRETYNRDPRAGIEAADYSNAEMGQRAAAMALERAGISPEQVGMVIGGGCAPDFAIPAEAARIANLLGIEAPCFDIGSACTSFYAAVNVLSMMDPEKLPNFVLVISAEVMTRTVDYKDRNSAVLWGDGSAAAVFSTRVEGRASVLGSHLESSPAGHAKVVIPRLGFFDQNGRSVQMFAIKKTIAGLNMLESEFADSDRPFHFVGHQANLRMLENVCRKCDIPDERHHFNVDWYGNTGAASGLSVVSMNWEKWQPKDDVALVGVGSGLTWGRYLLRMNEEKSA
ncbi:MAG: ketoacyl-ACP synthase III [Deltaproteobacteria bacterium]|nr:ketoacyl-ACP synthase III [Deltaproteobacteria bacterium]MBW2723602.1 ketoacyl-ACP synthase III [Deltaproteobacteria bacterium]